MSARIEQSLAADGAIACFSSNFFPSVWMLIAAAEGRRWVPGFRRESSLMSREVTTSLTRAALIVTLCWLSMIGCDFLLHGGLLATFYVQPSPFLLPLKQAFRLIPLGYVSFLLLAILLVWLMLRLDVRGGRGGIIFGVKLGALIWGALVLGLMSISTASAGLLAGWFVGQTIELGVAGAFAGGALGGARLTRLFMTVIALIFFSILITIALQSLGLAPSVRM